MATTPDSDSQSPIFLERLRELFRREEKERAHGGEGPRRPIVIVVCLLISCLLWFTFTLQETHTVTLDVPLTVAENLSGDQALTALPPDHIRAEIEGEGTDLLQLYWQPPVVSIDARSERVDLSRAMMDELPRGTQLQGIMPSALTLEREERMTRSLPIRLRARIRTPATHALMAPPRIEPDSVEVSGARSIIERINYWPTDSIVVTGLKDSLRRRVPLSDTLGRLVAKSTDSVVLTAQGRQFTEDKRQIDVRVTGGPQQSVTLEPSTIRVSYRVPVAQYQAARNSNSFFATVSYEHIRADTTGKVRPRIHIPESLTIRDIKSFPASLGYYNVVGGQ